MYHLCDQTGQADWGYNAISNGGNAENNGWRTLTSEEWKYIFNTRNTTSGIRWALGTVDGIGGIIILPDNWTASVYELNDTNGGNYNSNTITVEDWTDILEANGAVFLPAAGHRHTENGTGVSIDGYGFYWSSSHANMSWYAYCVAFGSDDGLWDVCSYNYNRHLGSSVRLVYSLRINATSNPVEGGSVSGGGTYAEGASCTLTATANPGYIFANWTENGEVVSSEASYSFTVTSNRNLVANFLYAISVVVMPENGGTVSGIGMDETDSLVVNYNFNNGLQGWTTIDADGDGNDWYCWNAYVMSHSWRNNVALHPDNYLVSPVVILGGSITFKARAGDNNYAAEHFGVAVSTTGTDASDFTIVEEWTMSAKAVGNWYEYTVDLSSFSGMGYVAIRHFNCSDMFTLQVDDVVITAPSSLTFYTGGYAEGQTCTLTAVPNTGWEFNNWTENGVEVSTEPTYSFTVDGGRNIVASFEQTYSTQPINLSQGTNWFSTNLDITLDDLKAALVAASPGTTITIKSQNSGQTTWNGRLWVGTLRTMDVSQMYMISVANACEITLEGLPIDPVEHPVTISNGPNWIGFPLGATMTITNAFAGFASPGDIVKSDGGGQATWNGRIWTGQLKNLEPGKGYIYQSAATGSRTFTFPTGAK